MSLNDSLPARRRPTLAPMLIGCAFVAVALVRQTRLGAWLRGFFSPRSPRYGASLLDLPAPLLHHRILGRTKSSVLLLCGQPRTAAVSTTTIANSPALWRADVWYYVVNAQSETAMAVRFVNDIARQIEFFGPPEI